jgi:hypothetical protein
LNKNGENEAKIIRVQHKPSLFQREICGKSFQILDLIKSNPRKIDCPSDYPKV